MVNFHLTLRTAAERKIKNFRKKGKNLKKEKKIEISAFEFMSAASLASLADSKVSNFKKFSKSRNSEKSRNSQNNEILKIMKFSK